MAFNQEYWQKTINNPDQKAEVERKVLWSVWNVLCATPLESRDEHWEHASEEIKKALASSE